MCLVREYEWLRKQMEEGFGKDMVEEIVFNAGRSLVYMAKNDQGRNMVILAEHDMDTPVIVGDDQYEVLAVIPHALYLATTSNYRFNDESDKIEQVEQIIKFTKERWSQKGGKRNG